MFNADELFAIAEKIESNGAQFYRQAAAVVNAPAAQQKLLQLASMEDQHLKTFNALRSELLPRERQDTIFDPLNETEQYLRAVADGHVFDLVADPTSVLADRSLAAIFNFAIAREKDSIVFYLGMKNYVPAKLGKDRIEDIIKEEMRHIITLSDELAALA